MSQAYKHKPNDEIKQVILRNLARSSLGSSTWRAIRWEDKHKDRKPLHHTITKYLVTNLTLEWFKEHETKKSDFNAVIEDIATHAIQLQNSIPLEGRINKRNELFGYAAKGISLYMRSVILHRDLLSDSNAQYWRPLCPSAIDKFVFDQAKSVKIQPESYSIKDYTKETWREFQKKINKYCEKEKIHPMDFDYIAYTNGAAPKN